MQFEGGYNRRIVEFRGSIRASASVKLATLAYPVEFRLGIVKLFLEEGYRAGLLAEQFGISNHSIQRWVRAFRLHGAEGLEPKRPVTRKSRVADEVRQQTVEVKKDHPEYGPRRITDVLKRFFLMRTSPATVHKTLCERGLVKKAAVKPEKKLLRCGWYFTHAISNSNPSYRIELTSI